jgi:hypothetical protein
MVRLSQADEALLKRTFRVADPRVLKGLSPKVPEGLGEPVVEFEYDARPLDKGQYDRPDVWCAHCKHETHWRGFVMRYEEGVRILVGKNCGEKIYGLTFHEYHATFNHQKNRQAQLQDLTTILPKLGNLATLLRRLVVDPRYKSFGTLQEVFHSQVSELVGAIRQSVRGDSNWLRVYEDVRDFEAEERRSKRIEAAKREYARIVKTTSKSQQARMIRDGEMPVIEDEKEPLTKLVDRPFMQVEGRAFLTVRVSDLLAMMASQAEMLEALQRAFEGRDSDSLSSAEISKAMRRIEGTKQDVINKMNAFFEMRGFFRPEHLIRLCQWASSEDYRGKYAFENGQLRFFFAGTVVDQAKLRIPAEIDLPSPSLISEVLQVGLPISNVA